MVVHLQVRVYGESLFRWIAADRGSEPQVCLLIGQPVAQLVGGVIDEDESRHILRVFTRVMLGDRAPDRMTNQDVGTTFSGRAQQSMEIRGTVL